MSKETLQLPSLQIADDPFLMGSVNSHASNPGSAIALVATIIIVPLAEIAADAITNAIVSSPVVTSKYDDYDDYAPTRENVGKSKGSSPGNNGDQNEQFKEALRQIAKAIGFKLTYEQQEKLHDAITGLGYGLQEIVQKGINLFSK